MPPARDRAPSDRQNHLTVKALMWLHLLHPSHKLLGLHPHDRPRPSGLATGPFQPRRKRAAGSHKTLRPEGSTLLSCADSMPSRQYARPMTGSRQHQTTLQPDENVRYRRLKMGGRVPAKGCLPAVCSRANKPAQVRVLPAECCLQDLMRPTAGLRKPVPARDYGISRKRCTSTCAQPELS